MLICWAFFFFFKVMKGSLVLTLLFSCQIINMYGELIMETTQHKVTDDDLFFHAGLKNEMEYKV